MTNGSPEPPAAGQGSRSAGFDPPGPAPVLVLGLGNLLLSDDGVGLRLLELLSADPAPGVEYVDGGTQGLALLGLFEGRHSVVVCDAVALDGEPGAIHVLDKAAIAELRGSRAGSAHESNALGLLQALTLLGQDPDELWVVGIEPEVVRTGIGLSASVTASLAGCVQQARQLIPRHASMRP
ncbi:hydrogenase maturation protease [Paludibaculum fermentans]|uniref:Hydrogenase maturation protease n=1 Tax=Paludibaculum fermentans TaxID=1473598 RepID=A0A7S7SLJ1_PALFE|nr:hydrogenase maturation protease [Paludibaculum fermentans]QOY88913.1 hydrogenase maturation protease [Paludibaculum fermentans]